MAAHDPIDPLAGSQDFYEAFYSFHKSTPYPWYIKNEFHHFIDGSDAFYEQFLPSNATALYDMADSRISKSGKSTIALMHAFESIVMEEAITVTLLVSGYFSYIDERCAYLIKLHPFSAGRVLGSIHNLTLMSDTAVLVNNIIDNKAISLSPHDNEVTTPTPEHFEMLTLIEWEIVWLKSAGKTFKQISEYLGVSHKSVEKKVDNIYHKLKVIGEKSLVRATQRNNWIRYIPYSILLNQKIIRIQ